MKKPGVVNKQKEIREYLCLTVVFVHDVTDGGPAARFINHLPGCKSRPTYYRTQPARSAGNGPFV
jgi:pyruvate/2-oxoglutarate dehydrogenase complex dihydrolipoamide acyltransferase (E2) component